MADLMSTLVGVVFIGAIFVIFLEETCRTLAANRPDPPSTPTVGPTLAELERDVAVPIETVIAEAERRACYEHGIGAGRSMRSLREEFDRRGGQPGILRRPGDDEKRPTS